MADQTIKIENRCLCGYAIPKDDDMCEGCRKGTLKKVTELRRLLAEEMEFNDILQDELRKADPEKFEKDSNVVQKIMLDVINKFKNKG